jgi:hypothetical protein
MFEGWNQFSKARCPALAVLRLFDVQPPDFRTARWLEAQVERLNIVIEFWREKRVRLEDSFGNLLNIPADVNVVYPNWREVPEEVRFHFFP